MAENALIKQYRNELQYLRKKLRERIAIIHKDYLDDLLWALKRNHYECKVDYLDEGLVRVTYWV